jgi:hypothetical protein
MVGRPGQNDRSKAPKRWSAIGESARAEFVRRVIARESVRAICAAMPEFAHLSARTLALYAARVRAAHGLVRSALPEPTNATRVRVLADLLVDHYDAAGASR